MHCGSEPWLSLLRAIISLTTPLPPKLKLIKKGTHDKPSGTERNLPVSSSTCQTLTEMKGKVKKIAELSGRERTCGLGEPVRLSSGMKVGVSMYHIISRLTLSLDVRVGL